MVYLGLLKQHRKVHESAEEQPYQCGHCGRGFINKHRMYAHFVTHINDEPFLCGWDMCVKRFKTASKFNSFNFLYY